MLKLVLKKDESLKVGEDIVIKSVTEGRVKLAIDAPKTVKIMRMESFENEKETDKGQM